MSGKKKTAKKTAAVTRIVANVLKRGDVKVDDLIPPLF